MMIWGRDIQRERIVSAKILRWEKLGMSVLKGTKFLLRCSELGERRDEIGDVVRDIHVGLVGLGKELVFHTRGNGINIS